MGNVVAGEVVPDEVAMKAKTEESEEGGGDDELSLSPFRNINGLGIKALEQISDDNIASLQGLRDAGYDYLVSLYGIGPERARSILNQIDELLDNQEQ
jgi:hypothetical protein